MKRRATTFKATPVICNKCGETCVGVPGTPHRRCGGSEGAPRRPKHEPLTSDQRGKWG